MEMFVGGGGNFCVFTMLIVSIRKGQWEQQEQHILWIYITANITPMQTL